MDVTGKVVAVLDLVSGTSKSGNPYQKREFVIETAGQYPKKVCFLLFGDKVNDCPAAGEEVKVSFNVESREYNERWYTQLNAWKIEKIGAIQPVQPPAPQPAPVQGGDDLPF